MFMRVCFLDPLRTIYARGQGDDALIGVRRPRRCSARVGDGSWVLCGIVRADSCWIFRTYGLAFAFLMLAAGAPDLQSTLKIDDPYNA